MPGYGYGLPGAYLTDNQRFAQLLAQMKDSNNGTVMGGIGSIIRQGLQGYLMGQDAAEASDAQDVQARAIKAAQGGPDSTITWNQPTRPDGSGDPTTTVPGAPPNRQLAAQLLASNPRTAPQAMSMMQEDYNYKRDRADKQSDLQGQRDFLTGMEDKKETFKSGQSVLDRTSKENIAKGNNAAAGKYYAVPTGSGTMLLDKGSGMAIMMGVGPDGSPVQIGKPFRPVVGADGMPTAIPTPSAPIDENTNLTPPPGAVPSAPPQTGARPLMPPSVDAQANAAKATAVGTAKNNVKKEYEANPAYSTLQNAEAGLDRLADSAKELRDAPGVNSITGLMSYVPNMPGGDAANAQAKMTTLKSQVAQNVLQMYRAMSQTGGAVGQVSNFEQEMFQNNLAALGQAQSPEEFKKQLDKIVTFVDGSKERMRHAYEMQYGKTNGAASAAPAQGQPATGGWSIQRVD